MKIILTKHAKERRKTGNIPEQRLWQFTNYLIKCHNLENQIDGSYKFRKAGTQAIIAKNKQKFILVTLFGPTGYIIEEDAVFGDFNCVYQSPEMLKQKAERKAKRKLNKVSKKTNSGAPLKMLNQKNKDRLKKETFEIVSLTHKQREKLDSMFGQKPKFVMKSKFNSFPTIDLLRYDGVLIKTFTLTAWNNLDLFKSN